ncbi:MAG TPA: cytochrome c [Opitutaceae bacterium]|nr:cytochrome c [Opitutaceae bacterium]
MSADSHSQPSKRELPDNSDESIQQVHADLLTNKPEPKEGYSVLPLFLLGLLSSLVFVCSIYLVHYRGGFSALVHDERFDPAKAQKSAVAAVDPVAAGKRLYNMPGMCVTCHQAQGQGVPGAFPPLAGSEWVNGNEERLVRILLNGLAGEITVHGQKFNGVMPAFGQGAGGFNWSDERIAHVLTYIRQEWGNKAGPVDTAKVTEIRTTGASAGRGGKPWTPAELEGLQ